MKEPKDWNYTSPLSPGFHKVITPENSICKEVRIFRLNLNEGSSYNFRDDSLEINGVLIEGTLKITVGRDSYILEKCDSIYLPAGRTILITAISNSVFLIGGALFEGKGEFFFRKYDPTSKDKSINQVHGLPPFRRDVFMTVAPNDIASRLICGITTGDSGMWTSWPPHQHSRHLEEVYCYFDLPKPMFALHLSSRYEGTVEFVHPVHTGNCVIIPEGYHPTVAMPGMKSRYFWVMAARSNQSRRYDLAVNDPEFEK